MLRWIGNGDIADVKIIWAKDEAGDVRGYLVETDAPYLAPVPHRGKTNEPAFVVNTAAKVAELRGVNIQEIERLTTANFRALTGI